MITKTKKTLFVASDGTEHASLPGAQAHELECLLQMSPNESQLPADFWKKTSEFIVEKAQAVLDILVTDGRRRRKARPAKPAKKGKEAKNERTPEN